MMLQDKVAVIYGAGSAIGGAAAPAARPPPKAFTNGFAPAIGASAAFALAGAITGLALPSRRGHGCPHPAGPARRRGPALNPPHSARPVFRMIIMQGLDR